MFLEHLLKLILKGESRAELKHLIKKKTILIRLNNWNKQFYFKALITEGRGQEKILILHFIKEKVICTSEALVRSIKMEVAMVLYANFILFCFSLEYFVHQIFQNDCSIG